MGYISLPFTYVLNWKQIVAWRTSDFRYYKGHVINSSKITLIYKISDPFKEIAVTESNVIIKIYP